MLILFILIWALCSILSYGFLFGYMQRKSDLVVINECFYPMDIFISFSISLLGPIAILIVLFGNFYKYGFRLW